MTIFRNSLVATAAILAAFASSQAQATTTTAYTTYNIAAYCTDCSQSANDVSASLTLNGSSGGPITAANFVSFTYDGSNLMNAFYVSVDGLGDNNPNTVDYQGYWALSGSISVIPAPNDFYIGFGGVAAGYYFMTSNDGFGSWSACGPGVLLGERVCSTTSTDFGVKALFNGPPITVPEPDGLALGGAALAALAVSRRRRVVPA